MITVLADQHHFQLKEHLHPSIRLITYDPIPGWSREEIMQADAVLVRTTNPLNADTLPEGSNIRFAGTASAGRDHLDEPFLEERGVRVADAKGSNARSVAEYVAVAVLACCDALDIAPGSLKAGIIGAGFTGSATAEMLERTGITCLLHDPPREEREKQDAVTKTEDTGVFRSSSLEDVLACDIISHHVPLELSGPHATRHWLDESKIRAAPKRIVVNASRGGVVDEQAIRAALHDEHIGLFVCDVWEGEPVFDDATAKQAFLATPHIAGYSIEAKQKATEMMCDQLHRFFGIRKPETPDTEPRFEPVPDDDRPVIDILRRLHPAFSYDESLRKLIGTPDAQKGPDFLRLRQNTPLRNEFPDIGIPATAARRHPLLEQLGFRKIDAM